MNSCPEYQFIYFFLHESRILHNSLTPHFPKKIPKIVRGATQKNQIENDNNQLARVLFEQNFIASMHQKLSKLE